MIQLITSDELAFSEIKEFARVGFLEIRISGGSSKDESHYSGVFLYFYDKESKKMYFLCVTYDPMFYKKHDTNGHTKKIGETKKETARRELYEETGLLVEEEDLELALTYSIKDRRDETKTHTKCFYFTDKYSGTLSDFGYTPNPIDGETSTPFWLPAKVFKKVLYVGHQQAFKAVMEHLMAMNLEYYYALCDL